MVFVVRRDLQWSKQKLSVMTAHAALALFKKLYKARNPTLTPWVSDTVLCLGRVVVVWGGAVCRVH
jgi:peptidyl-tRNA hydrolase